MAEKIEFNYRKLMEKMKNLFVFDSIESLINWDMETMMPPRAIQLRSEQLALMSRIKHKMITDPEIGKLLDKITAQRQRQEYDELDGVQKRNVYLIKKNVDEQTKLPEMLVAEIARQQAITVDVWKKAKIAKDFSIFRPELEKIVDLKKKAAEILMRVKETATPYDALIDSFEPKMTSEKIGKTFDQLREGLTQIMEKCKTAPKRPVLHNLRCKVPISIQRQVAKALAETVGYDVVSKNAGGRIDETEHPFESGYYDDVRITTHYYEHNFTSSIFSVLHEAGHALYEQNLKPEWMYQPVGTACSSGFHESQSRFVENIVGRSRDFWVYFLPKLKAIVGNELADIELDSFVHAINEVRPAKIRVEADEVTYCLHIIIRFDIERDLFAEKIMVKELPQVWNQKYKEHLGMDIENDSEGVMQDTHWASGLYGYFPSYALGNVYSGQILMAMEKDTPDWREQIAKGNLNGVREWLIKNVHSYGNLYDPADLIKKVTGEKLNVKPYLNYLSTKYSELYGF